MADARKVDIDAIEREILAGLKNEAERLDDALFNLEFYQGDFSRHPVREPNQNSDGNRYQRNSLLMQRTVNVKGKLLYKKGPKRTLKDHPEAQAWLEHVYSENAVDAIMLQADRYTYVSDVAAVQAEPCDDPDCPVTVRLWDASSFVVWPVRDEPRKPGAVATIDRYDNTRRLRLWTADEVREYRTDKWDESTKTAGATAYKRWGVPLVNELGVLPFVFVHSEQPTSRFWTPGPGCHFREANDATNKRLTDLFDSCRFNLDPILLLKNVFPGFRPPTKKPGDVWMLKGDAEDVGKGPNGPDASYLQADANFVMAGWEDLNNAIDHTLEMNGVQPNQVRAIQEAKSGDAIVAEQIEPVGDAESRQTKAEREERALAKLVLTVGAKHLGSPLNVGFEEYRVTAAHLEAAAANPGFVVQWPEMLPEIPGAEADASDQWALDNGLTSRTQLVMGRHKLSREEAEEYLKQVAEDVKAEATLFGGVAPTTNPPPAPQGADAPKLHEPDGDEPADG